MKVRSFAILLATIAAAASSSTPVSADDSNATAVDRGRYLVRIGGCNDCHTAGYMQTFGEVPESEWLLGSPLGWRGPWGTTYPPNLRLSLSTMTEDQWISFARNLKNRPSMPWYELSKMPDADLRAIYAFVHQLQPLGQPAPAYLPPDQQPQPPYLDMVLPPPAE